MAVLLTSEHLNRIFSSRAVTEAVLDQYAVTFRHSGPNVSM
jgi:hypothetical protein